MKTQLKNKHTTMKITDSMLVSLPTPTSISYMWNWGSMLGMMFIIQIMTGLLLASHYSSSVETAFKSIIHISRNVEFGFALRFIHMNGASVFFLIIFIHISRGFLFSSFKNMNTWYSGTLILLILMAIAFLGYVLPWGQMSFWGATVITNLLSAIPYVGTLMVSWLWGGFSIGMATLSRFFMLHFLMPFLLAFLVVLHLSSLHETGSNKPTGMNPNLDKTSFHPFFSNKDLLTAILILMLTMILSFQFPFFLSDPENFNPANPLNTPTHIQPEWYFLFAYAILRSIPNKLGGVTALVLSILMITVLSTKKKLIASKKFKPSEKNIFWVYSMLFCLLTWIGENPVEPPFENMGMLFSILYFSTLLAN